MRLDNPSTIIDEQEEEEEQDNLQTLSGAGAELWGFFYASLWFTATLMTALIYYPRPQTGDWLWAGLWSLIFAILAWVTNSSRISLHDMVVGFDQRERIFLDLIMLALFVFPAFTTSTVLPHGFLWSAPPMIMLAVRPDYARRLLAWLLLGGWFAALDAPDLTSLILLLAFATSWLIALGTAHFAFTGEQYGLVGWWPVRQAFFNALFAALPAALCGGLTWWLWPRQGPAGGNSVQQLTKLSGPPERLINRIDPMKMIELLWQGFIAVITTVILLALLLYLRRYLLRRGRVKLGADLLPGQVARLEYRQESPKDRVPGLQGLRGRIVALWGQWAAVLDRHGLGRLEGETAAQHAARLAHQSPDVAPPARMIELLEKAHYGHEEPRPADLESMRQYIQEEVSRISLHHQVPMDTIDVGKPPNA